MPSCLYNVLMLHQSLRYVKHASVCFCLCSGRSLSNCRVQDQTVEPLGETTVVEGEDAPVGHVLTQFLAGMQTLSALRSVDVHARAYMLYTHEHVGVQVRTHVVHGRI